jgi:subtilisin family serine protease
LVEGKVNAGPGLVGPAFLFANFFKKTGCIPAFLEEIPRPDREGMTHHLTSHWLRSVRMLLGTVVLAGGLIATTLTAPAAPSRETDQIIVKPWPGQDIAMLHAQARGKLKKTLKHEQRELEVIKLPGAAALPEALAIYRASAAVEYAEPDYILSASRTPNDPRFADGSLWSLHNAGQAGGLNDADIDAPEAWDVQTSATNVIVAVLDTGVRFTHEDLAANMWRNSSEVAGNGRDDDGNGYVDDLHGISALDGTGYPMDDNGHGTHVAGTIAGVADNGRGIAGVAWRAKIMALKFLDATGNGYTSDAIGAIDYARVKGAAVINASFGGAGASMAFRDALVRAQSAGVIFVAAAGNEASNNDMTPTYPANYQLDNMIVVAATTRGDTVADYSNVGARTVHLAAPGSSILSTYASADNAYGLMSGTSMATPHVAGAVAMVRAYVPAGTYRQVIDRILGYVDVLPQLANVCVTGGRLNLHKALMSGATAAPTPVRLALVPVTPAGQRQLRVTGVAGQSCVVEQSTDFVRWTVVNTMTLPSSGSADMAVSVTANQRAYFRAHSP